VTLYVVLHGFLLLTNCIENTTGWIQSELIYPLISRFSQQGVPQVLDLQPNLTHNILQNIPRRHFHSLLTVYGTFKPKFSLLKGQWTWAHIAH
jgi:hypothetical protein